MVYSKAQSKSNGDKYLTVSQRHEDVWGNGGIVPHDLNFRTRYRRIVSFTVRQ